MKKIIALFSIAVLAMFSAACKPSQSADQMERQRTEAMAKAAAQAVGSPNINNFTEKRFAKYLYELRDGEVATYTYFVDMHGKLHFLCESIGYGINASIQFVNPERYRDCGTNCGTTLPQPEPNGLFMPEGLAATYVMCSDGDGGVKPVYFEPEIIVSPFKLDYVK